MFLLNRARRVGATSAQPAAIDNLRRLDPV